MNRTDKTGIELVREALANPVGAPKLSELSAGKDRVVIIASDHTRPVPSKAIIPPMLDEIRRGNPEADIAILIATGCHRDPTEDELREKFGEAVASKEKIVIHHCADEANLVEIGTLPSGGPLKINRIAWEADLLVSEGFIEPHFFAGFSGGRKSVLPGIAARESVLANHCSEFVNHPKARTGT
ncbi:MAG: lactate racemase domain-containing protein, partial [Christensenellales bacterium]|nr:lactate racemase domain-containing protein [Christensenellales bacterium]